MDTFPLPANVSYAYESRFGTGPADHHGTDIFAERGTPVLAVERGIARSGEDPKGGLVVYLDSLRLEGTPSVEHRTYYYAHLDDVIDNILPTGTVVNAGDLLGHLGDSGNARGTDPHLHLQMRVGLVGLVDPYPILQSVDPHREPTPPQVKPPTPPKEFPKDPKRRAPPPPTFLEQAGGFATALLVLGVLWALSGRRRG